MAQRFGPSKPLDWEPEQAKTKGSRGSNLKWSLDLAEVVRVDPEHMVCDLRFLDFKGKAKEVPITSAFWSERGFLGAMPEEGSIAVCGTYAAHEDWTQPLILSFLPNGFKTALRFHPLGLFGPDDEDIEGEYDLEQRQTDLEGLYGVTRHKMRKLYPGDIYGASSKGAEFILDKGARLLDRVGGTLRLRPEDQTLFKKALDIHSVSGAARHRTGRVMRNDLFLPPGILEDGAVPQNHPLFDELFDGGLILEDGTPAVGVNDLPMSVTESGKRIAPIAFRGNHPDDPNADIYTEDRLEIQELTDQRMPEPGEEGYDVDAIGGGFEPFIERVFGTVVGNDPYSLAGRSKYGRVLRPVVFRSKDATTGSASLDVVQDESPGGGGRRAASFLYRMTRPDGNGELFVSHDKEGRLFVSVPSSTSGGALGGGRSAELDFKGSVKTTVGRNEVGRSLNTTTTGSATWTIGTENKTRRSVDATLEGGMKLQIERPDTDNNAIDTVAQGDISLALDGNMSSQIRGDQDWKVDGKRTIQTQAQDTSVGQGGANLNVTAGYSVSIKGSKSEQYARGHKTTIQSPLQGGANARQIRILSGNRTETFVAPATDTTQFAATGTQTTQASGALTCNWQAGGTGSFAFSAPSGSFSVNMGGGSISMTTGGAVTITAGATMQLTASNIGLNGTVGLGAGTAAPNPVVTGIPGPSPYIDPITGLPATGNPLVRSV